MAVTDENPVFYNPLDPSYMLDPVPHLRQMREEAPVHHTLAGPWAVFRYADSFRILRDASLSVDEANADIRDSERAALFDAHIEATGIEFRPSTSMLNVDPPDHTRLRRLVSKAFTPKTIENLRPQVQRLVDAALDSMAAKGTADLVGELAFPLPFDVISEMLGMPDSDSDQIRDWSSALVKTLDPVVIEEEIKAALTAGQAMETHLAEVILWKRDNRGHDLLTALLDAHEGGDRLSPEELADQVSLLFVAGHETTVNLIGNGIYELIRNPEQLQLLADDPTIEANAIDELLRYVAPVQFSRRIATADLEIDGHLIPSGSFVLTCLATSNRDPAQFGDSADALDLTREGAGQHLSFGSGAHYCLGASLTKLEAQVAIGSFVRRFPDAKVVGEPVWNGRINLRGLDKLMLEL